MFYYIHNYTIKEFRKELIDALSRLAPQGEDAQAISTKGRGIDYFPTDFLGLDFN
jgi:hypothetical protein